MRQFSRISGKKYESDSTRAQELKYLFDRRPGGWVIAKRMHPDGREERVRFFHSRSKKHFFTKEASIPPVEFFGERVQLSRSVSQSGGGQDYSAQFPGKVRKVSVEAGESVKAGTPLMMVEAMKMEFAIKASSDGVVVRVLVVEGMQIAPGQQLLEFEEKK
ncbi:MAG: acetyl-CoA carboxylase biotin carboxyl carrier protein subunit [Bdellovibrionales bacterium]|nr:acetyl-CoA carboxylase biotin carboxyl carrier protein subunit [Bdellovibrionales bacterium]